MSTTEEGLLEGLGAPVEVGSHNPLLLQGEGGWYVLEGDVDVFNVKTEDGQPTGRRSRLFRCRRGELVLEMPPRRDGSPMGLLAVGTRGTRLVRVERSRLRRIAADPSLSIGLKVLLGEWVDRLYRGVSPSRPPDECRFLAPGEFASDDDATLVRPEADVVWIRNDAGAPRLFGREDMALEDGALIPLSPHGWIEMAAGERVHVEAGPPLKNPEALWAGMERLHDLVLGCVVQKTRRASAHERERLRRKAAAERVAFANACRHIAGTLPQATPVHVETPAASPDEQSPDDALFAACRIIGKNLGIEVRAHPSRSTGGATLAPLDLIARASKFRVRGVMLKERWWREDGGPFLAFLAEGHAPVALLPDGPTSYVMRIPGRPEAVRVNDEVAERIEPQAHSFYRSLGDEPVGLLDLIRFSIRGFRRDLLTVLLMSCGAGLLSLVTPIATGKIFNDTIPGAARSELLQLILMLIVIAFATAMFRTTQAIAMIRVDGRMGASIQSAVWDRLLNLPTSFFRKYTAGELASRAMGIDAIRHLVAGSVLSALLGCLFAALHLGLLFYYSRALALWAGLLIGIAVAVTAVVGRLQIPPERAATKVRTKLTGQVLQYLTSISKLRTAGAEVQAFSLWAERFSAQRKAQFTSRSIANGLGAFMGGYPLIAKLVIFFLALPLLTEEYSLRTGDFLAFMAAFTTCMSGMISASTALLSAAAIVPMYEQAKPILSSAPEVDSARSDPGTLQGDIEVRHVCFRYQEDGPLILKDVTLQAKAGEFVAFVGPSGSGKSTMLRLLLGFEKAESGAIYYDEQDLSGLNIHAVRSQIGTVLQNGRLMSGDIFTNIVGSSLAKHDDAWAAAKMAGLDLDIKRMPMGMHTIVSEGGATLSGGQRQRLMIARALIRMPRVLFFDEATSALDNRTQAIVSESLDRMRATRVVVAHRLSTIMHADRIYVMDQGKVVESGDYAELMKQGGLFSELAKRQLV